MPARFPRGMRMPQAAEELTEDPDPFGQRV